MALWAISKVLQGPVSLLHRTTGFSSIPHSNSSFWTNIEKTLARTCVTPLGCRDEVLVGAAMTLEHLSMHMQLFQMSQEGRTEMLKISTPNTKLYLELRKDDLPFPFSKTSIFKNSPGFLVSWLG
jgi:hypothetical protein